MYDKGTIKLTTINPKDYTLLESGMYNTVEEALLDAQNLKDYLIFELQDVEGDAYRWRLLPYGSSTQYVSIMKMKDSALIKISMVAVLALAIYGLFKAIR